MPRTAEPPSRPTSATARRALPHHASRQHSHRLARAVGLVITAILAFTGTAAAAVLSGLSTQEALNPNLAITPTNLITPDPEDPNAGKALNILVVGTDLRDEANAEVAGEAPGGGADTTLLVHISGDRSWVQIVSIPRDSMVDVPSCNLPGGKTSQPGKHVQFNSMFTRGSGNFDPMKGSPEGLADAINYGVACVKTTVSALTRVPITNTVAVEMTGVIGVVDALGGVPVCLDKPIVGGEHSPDLKLPAGKTVLDGGTALEYVRARVGKGLGDGSDTDRIQRQQGFINNALNQMLSGGLLANAPSLYGVLGEALKSIRTDPGLDSATKMGGLAFSLRNLDSSRIVFTPLPNVPDPKDMNRVVWTRDADALWQQMATDQPPEGIAPPAPAAPAAPADAGAQSGKAAIPNTGAAKTAPTTGTSPTPAPPAAGSAGGGSAAVPPATEQAEHRPGECSEGWTPPAG